MSKFNRRDLIKLGGLAAATIATASLAEAMPGKDNPGGHIILMVFDAWSAKNVGFMGYPRDTMPNLRKFAKKAAVYHNHISTSNFTVPGTASLISGLYPWEHRAINLGAKITQEHLDHTVFHMFQGHKKTVGFAQNVYADQVINPEGNDLEIHLPFGTYNLHDRIIYDSALFNKDSYAAFNAFEDGIVEVGKGIDASLFLGPLIRFKANRDGFVTNQKFGSKYYEGLPESIETYTLKDVADGLIDLVDHLSEPSFVYFHVFAPHDPYRPYSKFYNSFADDGFVPELSLTHPAISHPESADKLNRSRVYYDAFLASLDSEVGRFYDYAESTGLVNSSHIIITSDHGETFDRGTLGHAGPLLSQPLIQVPLVISSPDRIKRDHFEFTSCVDVLPTIAKIGGLKVPEWVNGQILPGFVDEAKFEEVPVYSIINDSEATHGNWKRFSISAIFQGKKVIYYQSENYKIWELFDIENDPDERADIFVSGEAVTEKYKALLIDKMNEVGMVYKG